MLELYTMQGGKLKLNGFISKQDSIVIEVILNFWLNFKYKLRKPVKL